jgi:Zn-dependent protease
MAGNPMLLPVLGQFLFLNVALAIFNLLPVPPLDGSRIVAWLLPRGMQETWHRVEAYSPMLLIAIFLWGGRIVSGPIDAVSRYFVGLISLIA